MFGKGKIVISFLLKCWIGFSGTWSKVYSFVFSGLVFLLVYFVGLGREGIRKLVFEVLRKVFLEWRGIFILF